MDNLSFEEIIDLIKAELISDGIEPTDDIFDKLEKYYSYLVEYNNKVNLTAITDKNDVYIKHFLDCIKYSNLYNKNAILCDIGTGAGFPGVVLKIIRPDLKITLVDSLNKRVVFLNNLIKLLDLKDITALHYRAEDAEFKNRYLNSFDYVVARAVAEMPVLTEYCLPYVKVGGHFVAYKGGNGESETNLADKCIKMLGGRIENLFTYSVLNNERTLVIINKISLTDKKYPRGQNKPRLLPIR